MPFADILYEYLGFLLGLTIGNLIWCFGSRLYRKRKFSHMELAPLRGEVLQALLTSVLAATIAMIIRTLWP